jgi:hypothetical protein
LIAPAEIVDPVGAGGAVKRFQIVVQDIRRRGDPSGLASLLKTSVRDDAPSQFNYVDAHDLKEIGNSPPGFFAEYTRDGRTIYVVVIIVDVRLEHQIDAAVVGDALNPRNKGRATSMKTKAKANSDKTPIADSSARPSSAMSVPAKKASKMASAGKTLAKVPAAQ